MKLRSYLTILCLSCACSCNRYYYTPNGVNAPLLTEAKEVHLSGSVSVSGDGSMTDIQASYSPINHLGIIGNYSAYSYQPGTVDVANGNVAASAHLGDLGVGYYAASKGAYKGVLDIYGGYGGGYGGGYLHSDVNMNFHRYFIQPGVGFRTPYFEFSLNYRVLALKYYDLNANGRDTNYLVQNNLVYGSTYNKSINNSTYWFGEPAFTFRGGYKFIKAQMQYVFSNPISHVPWRYNTSEITLGLSFELEDLLKLINGNSRNKLSHE